MLSANKKVDIALLSLMVISCMLIFMTTPHSPSHLILGGTYGWPHFMVDWTTLAILTSSTLIYDYIQLSRANETIFAWMKWSNHTIAMKVLIFFEVVTLTALTFTSALNAMFGRHIRKNASLIVQKALNAANVYSFFASIIIIFPTCCLYYWIKWTGRHKKSEEDQSNKAKWDV